MEIFVKGAAYHEAAHAVIAVAQGMPLQNTGIHIDTLGEGITFYLHREPGDLTNGLTDITERHRTIIALKAGYRAQFKAWPAVTRSAAANDQGKEGRLLNEMYSSDPKARTDADINLEAESRRLIDQHWGAIEALAECLLSKPLTPIPPETKRKWRTPDSHERWMNGSEIAALLQTFQLSAIVRDESEGEYITPDLLPSR
jgi:hypothetical protein